MFTAKNDFKNDFKNDLTTAKRRALPNGAMSCLVAAAIVLSFAVAASAEEPQTVPPDEATRTAPPVRPSEPGLFAAIGRWVDESVAHMTTHFKGANETLGDAAGRAGDVARDAAKDAATAVSRLPKPSVVSGRELCPNAPNGAPDCAIAIAALCRTKGFSGGRSLDVQTEQKCAPKVLASGRVPTETECYDESYVTRAICQ